MATGDQSGTWGTTTNTNLELIGQALGWGTRAIANASTDNITIADGASDADRSMALKLTGGGQACTVTILPNTSSKVWVMENATAATLTFTQGSGANVAILAGETKMIATDGLGSGAVVYDVLTDLNLAGTTKAAALTVAGTVDAATVEFNNLSGTSAVNVTDIADEDNMSSNSATKLATQQSIKAYVDAQVDTADTLTEVLAIGNTTATDQKIQFRDAAIHISSSTDGQLDLVADTEIQIAATTVDINGAVDLSADLSVGDDLTVLGGVIDFKSNSGSPASLKMYCETSNAHFQTLQPQPHSAAASNTLRLPDSGDSGTQDLVAVNTTQTLTNKSLTSPTITGTAVMATLDISGDVDVDGTLEADAITLAGTALGSIFSPIAGGGSIVTTGALNSGSITSGFGTINNGSSAITTTGVGTFASLDISGSVDVDGTLEADAITLNGTALGSIYSPIAGSGSIVTTGAINSGSITSGFGTINNGSSTITTSGAVATGVLTTTGDITLSGELNLTASSNNYIDFTDALHIRAIGSTPAYEDSIYCIKDAAVSLMYNGSAKIATTNTGVSVTGDVVASANVTAYSDLRIKDNLEVIPDALSKVEQLNGYTYTRKDLEDKEEKYTGVIAQEVLKVLPEAVVLGETPEDNMAVAYGNMVGLLIEAIKELKTEIEELKATTVQVTMGK